MFAGTADVYLESTNIHACSFPTTAVPADPVNPDIHFLRWSASVVNSDCVKRVYQSLLKLQGALDHTYLMFVFTWYDTAQRITESANFLESRYEHTY